MGLDVKQKRSLLSVRVADIAIVVFVVLSITFDEGSLPVQIARVVLVGAAILETSSKRPTGGVIVIWQLLFVSYAAMSVGWALSESNARTIALTVLINGVCIVAMAYLVNRDAARVRLFLVSFMIAPAFLMLRVAMDFGLFVFLDTRATGTTSANIVGMTAAFGCCIAFVGLTQKALAKPRVCAAFLAINLAVTVLSASRKAILVVGLALLLYSLLKAGKRIEARTIGVAITSVLIFLGYWLIMNVSSLYNSVGYRFETMLNGLFGTGEVDASTATRLNLVEYGLAWFRDEPWLGHGGDNFRALMEIYYSRQTAVYSHNNFIEVLVNFGAIGFILFYWVYALIIGKGLYRSSTFQPLQTMVLSLTVVLLVVEYGFVDYYSRTFMSFIAVAWVVVCTNTLKSESPAGASREAGRAVSKL